MELIVQLLRCIEIIVFAWGIVRMRFHRDKFRLLTGAVAIVCYGILSAYVNIDTMLLLIAVLVLPKLGIVLLFEERLLKGVIKVLFCDSYISFVYLPVRLVVTFIWAAFNSEADGIIYKLICSVISIVLLLLVAYAIDRKREIAEWIGEIPVGYFVIAWICGTAVDGINSYSNSIMGDMGRKARLLFESLRTILSVAIYILGIGFSMADYLRKKYRDESRLKDEYLRMSKRHYEKLIAHVQEIRSIKHDINNHINIISRYAECDNIPALKEYVRELVGESKIQTGRFFNTGNEVVDAVLTDGMSKYKADEIVLECNGKITENIKINNYDLCTIFANLLSNAIEACEKLVNNKKIIRICFECDECKVKIVFENPVEWDVNEKVLGSYTSKADKENHGFGISNIRKVVEKYGGSMLMGSENGKFRTIIVIDM